MSLSIGPKPQPPDELLVAISGMKLDPVDVGFDVRVEFVLGREEARCPPLLQRDSANQAIRELACAVRLAGSRRTVEDDLLLVEQKVQIACPVSAVRFRIPDAVKWRPV